MDRSISSDIFFSLDSFSMPSNNSLSCKVLTILENTSNSRDKLKTPGDIKRGSPSPKSKNGVISSYLVIIR